MSDDDFLSPEPREQVKTAMEVFEAMPAQGLYERLQEFEQLFALVYNYENVTANIVRKKNKFKKKLFL